MHTQFRPSDVCVGADGAIYVSDWFDGRVGGHQTLDDTLGGAIYRIAPKGFVSTVPTFDLDTLEGQVAALKSPAVNVRQLGRTRLAGIADRQAMIRFVVKANDRNPYVAMRGQWVVLQLDVVPDETIDSFLAAPKPEARLAALNLDRSVIRAPISGLISPPAVALGAFLEAKAAPPLATIVTIDPAVVAYRVSYSERAATLETGIARSVEELLAGVRLRLRLPGDRDYPAEAIPHAASAEVDERTGGFTVWARFPNPDALLRPGMAVTVLSSHDRDDGE